ncbi:MAG: 3-deoxy-D-manno-octulosonic acid transferase [Bacteroidetes bacterium]|nr:3-deoxy-D-manno-octulosonic acid transferase [Bacteroidota bacterium]MDA0860538.1 3-deoxy-D-manno-octulosonic acid transferase [Bacteroidota bacterium]MDA1318302.1 3-deoxy-D-manno-octulosonic acid transferase [Bacteroidota bacterium]
MLVIYNLITAFLKLLLPIAGGFNAKLKKGIDGRKKTFETLQNNIQKGDTVFWFHCASLGEYEQGLPVFEKLKSKYPKAKIVLSFFSPSGYEVRKKNPLTSIVVYLPLDTKRNAELFLKLVNPKLVVFVKYDLWPNCLKALKNHSSKVVLISALLRPHQHFFKFYGKAFQKLFFSFDYIFTQNSESKELLKSIGYCDVTESNDTRFDRVSNQLTQNNSLPYLEDFIYNKLCVVAGSTWEEDENILAPYIQKADKSIKFIIAPHSINKKGIKRLMETLGDKAVLFSKHQKVSLSDKQVFIVDTIGILSKIYNYANIAYVGGGMGSSGLHNTLEAAVFGIPIIIGKNYDKFPEAKEMLERGGLFSVRDYKSFETTLDRFVVDANYREKCGKINKIYIEDNKGATSKILAKLTLLIKD